MLLLLSGGNLILYKVRVSKSKLLKLLGFAKTQKSRVLTEDKVR